ncbi:MAG: DUF1836 domain-containing protein [Lachnospiraceae bacterium]|nr:DUF1836 domain-containing protein [Lachnospiraceae bacterium]
MSSELKTFLKEITSIFESLDYVKPESIPNIDLYMDQVTTFMDTQLESTKRHPDDKILTKTMINNYAKNDLLPPPVKKKYSEEHLLLLIFIYYFKNILSINDIQTMLKPITERYFGKDNDINLKSIYEGVFSLEHEDMTMELKEIVRKYKVSQSTFKDVENPDDKALLDTFSFVCMLSFDIYVKKMVLEKIIDKFSEENEKSTE